MVSPVIWITSSSSLNFLMRAFLLALSMQVGGEELQVVGGAGGVAGDLDLELADERVLVDPVNTDPQVSLPQCQR